MLDSGLQKGLNVSAFNDVKWDKKKTTPEFEMYFWSDL